VLQADVTLESLTYGSDNSAVRLSRKHLIGNKLVQRAKGSAPGFLLILPEDAGPPPFFGSFGSSWGGAGVGAGAEVTGTSSPQPPDIANIKPVSVATQTNAFSRIYEIL
jgi:hypothetical protein